MILFYIYTHQLQNTLDLIKKSKPNAIFAQGDNPKCVNFKSNVETYDYLITLIQTTEMPVTMFSTTETMIKLPKYNKQLHSSLGKILHRLIYDDFLRCKMFGTRC